MKFRPFLVTFSASALALGTLVASAAEPVLLDTPYPGTIELRVDATDLNHRVFVVNETIPVQPGPMTLLYPQWLPGKHRPAGPIEKLAGLIISANGEPVPWKRNQLDVYEFDIEVPEGVSSIDVSFQYLSPQDRRQGRVVMTPQMLNLQWNTVALYPAGYNASQIPVSASVTLPTGWKFGTALEVDGRHGDTAHFKTIDFANLVDSPMFAGKYFKQVDLDPGAKVPVRLNIVADAAKYLEITPKQLAIHREMVDQMYKLYGAQHFDHYDFLLALTDRMSGIGLEHHRSSENGVAPGYFTKWDEHWLGRDLLAHEFNHSWNGKYRRGADLATPNFNVPMGDSLLWVYEGQTQYWGNVVAARSGLVSKEHALDGLAHVAATYDMNRPGDWRSLQDTTNDPVIAERAPLAYDNYQRSEDYYSGGQLVWLAVDAKLRELSDNGHSLDDFAKAFFGMNDGDWNVNPYIFEDVVETLHGIETFDWAAFLRSRLDGHGKLTDGISASGWRLVYTDQPSDLTDAMQKRRERDDFTWSIGLRANDDGGLRDVRWDGPAFNAGLAPGMKLIAVNGQEYSGDALKDAIIAAADDDAAPIDLLVKEYERYRTLQVDYHDGLKYPHLERIAGQPDYLSDILEPK